MWARRRGCKKTNFKKIEDRGEVVEVINIVSFKQKLCMLGSVVLTVIWLI
jgi:hypothetical protein